MAATLSPEKLHSITVGRHFHKAFEVLETVGRVTLSRRPVTGNAEVIAHPAAVVVFSRNDGTGSEHAVGLVIDGEWLVIAYASPVGHARDLAARIATGGWEQTSRGAAEFGYFVTPSGADA